MLQFINQGATADSERLGGFGAIKVMSLEGEQDGFLLYFLESFRFHTGTGFGGTGRSGGGIPAVANP